MQTSRSKILWLLVAILIVALLYSYVNFIAPWMKTSDTKEAVQPVVSPQSSFYALKPKRAPSEGEVKQAVEMIGSLYGGGNRIMVLGDPAVVSLHAPEAEQLVLTYEATDGNTRTSALEVLDIASDPHQSVFHREGEDFQYHEVSVGEGNKAKSYLLVEERTGATGNFLNLSFMEYDGVGRLKEFYALQDMSAAFLYLLQNNLLLERDHAYYEIVKEQALVRLIDYDIKARLGFHILSYGFKNGDWYVKHNGEALLATDAGLVLVPGDEIFLMSDMQGEKLSVRTLIDGSSLEYVNGPPVHILAVKAGEGSIHFISDADKIPEYTLPVQVVSAKK